MHPQEEFKLTDEAFDVLNFSETEKMDCYRVMSGVMHMGKREGKEFPHIIVYYDGFIYIYCSYTKNSFSR